MKKVVIVTLIAVMAAFSFVSVASAANFMSIATGGTTGTYYAVGGAIANAVTKAGKVQVTAETGNASVANVNLVNTKGIELAFTQADIAYWAYNGQLMFQGKPLKNLRAVCALYPEHIQVIVTKDAKMKKFTDIKGKRVGVGAPGSAVEIYSQAGLTYKDLAKADFLDFAATTSRFKDNHIDVGFVVAGFPTASVMDLLTTKNNITLFSFDDAFLKALNKTYPFMVPSVIPAGTYKGISAVKTPAITSFLVTYNGVSGEDIYNFLDGLYKNINEVHASHAKGKEINLKTGVEGLTIPLHPAAAKFFRDKGIIKK